MPSSLIGHRLGLRAGDPPQRSLPEVEGDAADGLPLSLRQLACIVHVAPRWINGGNPHQVKLVSFGCVHLHTTDDARLYDATHGGGGRCGDEGLQRSAVFGQRIEDSPPLHA
jgi:hypothetical protein